MRAPTTVVLLAAAALAGCAQQPTRSEAPSHEQQVLDWRQARVTALQRPNGWLSLVGLHWLDTGHYRIGSGDDAELRLATGPARLGELVVHPSGNVVLHPAAGAPVTIDGTAAAGPVALVGDHQGTPTEVAFNHGRAYFTLIQRSGRLALRVRDADAPTRTGFSGIDYFPIDPDWRFDARFEPHPPGRTIDIANVTGALDAMANPGAVVFEHEGRSHRLEAVDEGDGRLFLIVGDRTNGRSTYGAGRFVYADPPAPGRDRVELDFNRLYNPPCVFTAYSTCPLPPPENRLDLVIEAGEKAYRGPQAASASR